jgi:hypothetical protein
VTQYLAEGPYQTSWLGQKVVWAKGAIELHRGTHCSACGMEGGLARSVSWEPRCVSVMSASGTVSTRLLKTAAVRWWQAFVILGGGALGKHA